jgi:hypothetical protein
MSMWLNLAKLAPVTYEAVRREPDLLDGVFFTDDAALPGYDPDADRYGEPFFLTEPDYDAEEWLLAAQRTGEKFGYAFNNGPAFALTPSAMAPIVALAEPDSTVATFLENAVREGKVVVGGIS